MKEFHPELIGAVPYDPLPGELYLEPAHILRTTGTLSGKLDTAGYGTVVIAPLNFYIVRRANHWLVAPGAGYSTTNATVCFGIYDDKPLEVYHTNPSLATVYRNYFIERHLAWMRQTKLRNIFKHDLKV